MNDLTNPRERIGGNNPPLARSISAETGDFASVTTEFLTDEYSAQPEIVAALLDEARLIPKEIEDDDTKGKVISLIKRFRDTKTALVAHHEKEKQPYLRGGQAVDQFFFGLIDKCMRRTKTNNPGAADVLQARLTDYDNRVLAREQERRRLEAEKAAKEAARIAREAAERERIAEDARLAAERARVPERKEEKAAVADKAEAMASESRIETAIAEDRAEAAHISTLAKPADIMRTRGADGTLSTVGREAYAEVVDADLLDKAKLWPFISADSKEKALRAWAKTTGHREQMAGASIGHRNKSVVR